MFNPELEKPSTNLPENPTDKEKFDDFTKEGSRLQNMEKHEKDRLIKSFENLKEAFGNDSKEWYIVGGLGARILAEDRLKIPLKSGVNDIDIVIGSDDAFKKAEKKYEISSEQEKGWHDFGTKDKESGLEIGIFRQAIKKERVTQAKLENTEINVLIPEELYLRKLDQILEESWSVGKSKAKHALHLALLEKLIDQDSLEKIWQENKKEKIEEQKLKRENIVKSILKDYESFQTKNPVSEKENRLQAITNNIKSVQNLESEFGGQAIRDLLTGENFDALLHKFASEIPLSLDVYKFSSPEDALKEVRKVEFSDLTVA